MIADGKEITQDKGKNHFLNAVPSFFFIEKVPEEHGKYHK